MRCLPALLAAVTLVIGAASTAAQAVDAPTTGPEAARKLHALGYPSDLNLAIQRWRADNLRNGTGPLAAEEAAALLAQPMPEFLAALVGNPFTGMGLAMRHKSREAAEAEAINLCKQNGGGSACTNPMVTRSEQCVAVVGFSVVIDRRPTYRTSVAVSTETQKSLDAATEGCKTGATHPAMCKPLVTFCGDGRDLKVFEEDQTPAAESNAAR